jgi:hypothetical protein
MDSSPLFTDLHGDHQFWLIRFVNYGMIPMIELKIPIVHPNARTCVARSQTGWEYARNPA